MGRKHYAWLLLIPLAFTACSDDDDSPMDQAGGSAGDGGEAGAGGEGAEAGTAGEGGEAGAGGEGAEAGTAGEGGEAGAAPEPVDPDEADEVAVDRFSEDAGTLMVRDGENGLPEANAPIDFDQGPFITTGLGPDGQVVQYYNFDVQPFQPAPIYVLTDGDAPIADQLNIVDAIPGTEGYSDFWQVVLVTVPEDYVANTMTSFEELEAADLEMEATDMLVNCPIVPAGSTAELRFTDESNELTRGWYQGQVVYYFNFSEAPLMAIGGSVPVSPIYVTFNDNGGPPAGFVTEPGTDQTHNVLATLPGDEGYSPLWFVNIYESAEFDAVSDLATAVGATQLMTGPNVNCPVVAIEE